MKKNFKSYTVCWAAALVLFNIIAFVVPRFPENDKFGSSFFIGYIFVTVAFVGNLICVYIAFKNDNLQKFFYSLPIVTLAYSGLIVSFAIGCICMLVSYIPYWVGVLVCYAILAVYAIAIVKAQTAGNIVSDKDDRIKSSTAFVKNLTIEADALMKAVNGDAAKAACKKVYEAIRYSDPVSSNALTELEGRIEAKFSEFAEAAKNGDERIVGLAEEVVMLAVERNRKAKLSK